MSLSPSDVKLFYALFPSLLLYVNEKKQVIPEVEDIPTLMTIDIEERSRIHDVLYEDIAIIDQFVAENPYQFAAEDLQIIKSWKQFKKGTFYIFRHLKKYTVFLSTDDGDTKAYGVTAISDPLDLFYPHLPIMVKSVLLPFKDNIIYDGIMRAYSIYFGGGIRRSLKDSYNQAKAKYGIITDLSDEEEVEQSDEELLKFYLKSKTNREYYREEILDLIEDSDELFVLYHQEMAKIHAKSYKKKLQDLDIDSGFFAVLNNVIVASGQTKKQVEGIVNKLVPEDKREWIHIFEMKPPRKKKK